MQIAYPITWKQSVVHFPNEAVVVESGAAVVSSSKSNLKKLKSLSMFYPNSLINLIKQISAVPAEVYELEQPGLLGNKGLILNKTEAKHTVYKYYYK